MYNIKKIGARLSRANNFPSCKNEVISTRIHTELVKEEVGLRQAELHGLIIRTIICVEGFLIICWWNRRRREKSVRTRCVVMKSWIINLWAARKSETRSSLICNPNDFYSCAYCLIQLARCVCVFTSFKGSRVNHYLRSAVVYIQQIHVVVPYW